MTTCFFWGAARRGSKRSMSGAKGRTSVLVVVAVVVVVVVNVLVVLASPGH